MIYLYVVTDKYHHQTSTNTLTIKIFLAGHKQTPLIIDFLTLDHIYMGQVLKSGIKMYNYKRSEEEIVNLNEPKYIRELILLGRAKGWEGANKVEKQNGLHYLETLGYDVNILLPIEKAIE